MTVVTLTDLLKSVRNCYVIEVFGGVVVLSLDFNIPKEWALSSYGMVRSLISSQSIFC